MICIYKWIYMYFIYTYTYIAPTMGLVTIPRFFKWAKHGKWRLLDLDSQHLANRNWEKVTFWAVAAGSGRTPSTLDNLKVYSSHSWL